MGIRTFTFNGESSATYGVLITQNASFNAPDRAGEMISIPGRNGAYWHDLGRFENIEVTYHCAVGEGTKADFVQTMSDLRSWLCSPVGYCRLEDDYNPDEYRMAVYKSGLETSEPFVTGAEFEITFDCKPQRFLKSGEDPITIGEWGETETYTGAIAQFENPNGWLAVKSLTVDIEPAQSGSGTPSPDNVRPITGWTGCNVVVSPTEDAQDGTTYPVSWQTEAGTVYGGTVDVVSGVLTVERETVTLNGQTSGIGFREVSQATTADGTKYIAYIPMNSFGMKQNNIALSDSYAFKDLALNSIHVGEFNARSSYMRFVIADQTLDTLSKWNEYLANNPMQLVYELATPTTYQLDPVQVACLLGQNNVWNNVGDTSIEVGNNPNYVINPTLFDAKPQLQVWGYGDIGINGQSININNVLYGNIKVGDAKTSTATGTVQKTLDLTNVNTGDDIIVDYTFSATYGQVDGRYNPAVLATTVSGTDCVATASGRTIETIANTVTFNKGTSSTETFSATYTVKVTNTVTHVSTETACTLSGSIEYDGSNKIKYGATVTAVTNTKITRQKTMPAVYANSTMSALGHPMYIDLDIGESYNTDGGSPVSVNDAVSMPAELPVLPSGATTITYDNTVTQFKIVPRWWSV